MPSEPQSDQPTAEQGAPDPEVRRQLRRLSRRGFAVAGISALGGFGIWRWLGRNPDRAGVGTTYHDILRANESIARALFRPSALAREWPPDSAREPRVNGNIGMTGGPTDPGSWRLQVRVEDGPASLLSLDQLRALSRVESTTELKCVEGWSRVVRWAGVRLFDLARALDIDDRRLAFEYVSLETPDGGYYVGLDAEAAFHPQSILAYEMNGQPLTDGHGAPLRLAIPIKYGIKNIKRVGSIRFTSTRPRDYWAERGYDWYAGL